MVYNDRGDRYVYRHAQSPLCYYMNMNPGGKDVKKTQLKGILVSLLLMGTLTIESVSVSAATVGAQAQTATAYQSMEQPLIGVPFTDVTEDDAQAFERSLVRELNDTTGQTTQTLTLAERAQKKARAMTALYGETSIQYAVMQKGELLLSDAYGTDDAAKKTSVTTDSVYAIASISKMFVTAAVQQLCEAGKLNLDRPVVDYIPEFRMKDERYKDITVRMLLNHSSGLMGGGLNNALLFDDPDTSYHDHFLEKLAGETLKADPGAYSVYCNDGFELAELVVERVSGEDFSDYLQSHIFTPLGLAHTCTTVQMSADKHAAGIYTEKGGTKLPTEYLNAIGAGGLYSTAEDLCRFGMSYTDHSGRLLSQRSVQETYVQEGRRGQWCEEASGIVDYGLGWDSVALYPFEDCGIQAAEKGGDSIYYHGMLLVFPDQDLAVAVLSSGGTSTYNGIFGQYLATEILKEQNVLAQEQLDSVPTSYETHKQTVPAEWKQYAGYYVSMAGTYQIKMQAKGMQVINLNQPNTKMKFVYSGDGQFVYPGGTQMIRFLEQDGNTYLMAGTYGKLPGISTMFSYVYTGQKVPELNLKKSVKKAWQQRDGKSYFLLTEKASSIRYVQGTARLDIDLSQSCDGYLYYNRITDADTAEQFTDMPMSGSRDATDFVFEKDAKGVEYMHYSGGTAIREDGLKNLSSKKSYMVRINSKTGYAKWYRISKKTADKKLRIKLPANKNAMVAVYDAGGEYRYDSYLSTKRTVALPEDGYVVFVGDPGASIKVTIK